MAIQNTLEESAYGVAFQNAYLRIDLVVLARSAVPEQSKHYVSIDIACFAAPPKDQNTKPLELKRIYASINEIEMHAGSNFLEKCYAWLMSQPDMVGSSAV